MNVENNLLGGNEDTQTKFVQEHGKDIASCSTNPGGAECKRGEAVNKAIAAALVGGATGGVVIALTPEAIAAARQQSVPVVRILCCVQMKLVSGLRKWSLAMLFQRA